MCVICKKCGSDAHGFVIGKQRYLCKVCGMNFTAGDSRKKHSYRVIRAAIDLYIEGNGFRRISRLLKKIFDVCYQLVIHWIKSAAEKIYLMESDRRKNKVSLIELDELFSYIKKKQIKSEYGLLLIETGYVLLDLRSAMQALKHSENFGTK